MKIKLRIATRLFLFIFTTSLLIYVVAIGVIGINLRNTTMDNAKHLIDLYAKNYAHDIGHSLDNYLDASRTLAQAFEAYENLPEAARRPAFRAMMRNVLESNPDFLSVWTIWDPYTIDTLDSLLTNEIGNSRIGNFSTTLYREKGEIKTEGQMPENELFTGDYYTVPKNTLRETILSPYYYSYTGKRQDEILQTNLIVPVRRSGKFMGIVGIDAALERFQSIVDTIRPYRTGYAFILAHDGSVVAHPDTLLLGKKIAKVAQLYNGKHEVTRNVQAGKAFSFIDNNLLNGQESYISYMPVEVGDTKTPWTFAIAVPTATIMEQAQRSLFISIVVGVAGMLLLLIVIGLISLTITRPLVHISKLMKDLNKADVKQLEELSEKHSVEINNIAQAAHTLITWLNATGEFARQIGEGNLDAEYDLLSKNDALGTSLLEMRDRLREAQKEEEKRLREDENRRWTTEGIAKFADILRQNTDDMEEFSYSIISNLVKYMRANQGGLFLINDDDQEDKFIELQAAYAYEQRKYRYKRINMGVGLVGRCIQENETIYLTEVPSDYVNITSGLGDETPRCLLIVPLKFNEETYGVVEIALFRTLQKFEIEFVEKVSESIASTISTVKISLRTTQLLEQSQKQSEELAMHEEEMRQNLEELQATLEESARREKELEAHLKTIDASLATVEYDPKGNIQHTNNLFLSLTGYTQKELAGKHHRIFFDDQYSNSHEYQQFWERLRSGVVETGDFIYTTKTGTKICLNSGFTPVLDANGRLSKVIQYSNDITRLYNKELAHEDQIAGVSRITVMAEYTIDGVIKSANRLFAKTLGYKEEKIAGKNLETFVDYDFHESREYPIIWQKLRRGKLATANIPFVNSDNEMLVMKTVFCPVVDIDNRLQYVISFGYQVDEAIGL